MKDSEIHVGDILRIRSFEDMKLEFGMDEYEHIHGGCGVWFGDDMGELCGKTFTVSAIEEYEYRSVENIENDSFSTSAHWCITSWMLEPYEDDNEWTVADDDEIAFLLS